MEQVRIEELVKLSIREVAADFAISLPDQLTPSTTLFGASGPFTYHSLLALIVDLESLLREKTERDVILADESTMNPDRSPFQTIGSLTDFIQKEITAS